MDSIDVRRLRGLLAEHQITHRQFALACGLHRVYVGRIMAGSVVPGYLARIKLQRGLQQFGLAEEVRRAG